jgi:hypothetical protein
MCWITNPNLISRLIIMHKLILRFFFTRANYSYDTLAHCNCASQVIIPPFSYSPFLSLCIALMDVKLFFPFFHEFHATHDNALWLCKVFFFFSSSSSTHMFIMVVQGCETCFLSQKGLIFFSTHWVSRGWLWGVCVCVHDSL